MVGEVAPNRFLLISSSTTAPNERIAYLDGRQHSITLYDTISEERFLGLRQGSLVSIVTPKDSSHPYVMTRRVQPPFDAIIGGSTDRGVKAVGAHGEVMSWFAAPGDQLYAGAAEGMSLFLNDGPDYQYFGAGDAHKKWGFERYAIVSLGSRFYASTHRLRASQRLGITAWNAALRTTHLFAPRGYEGLVAEAVSRTGDIAGRALAEGKDDLYVKRMGQKPFVIPAPKWAVGGRLVAQEFLRDGTIVGTLERDNEKSTEVWVVRGRTLTRLVGNTAPLKITWAQYVGLGYDEKSFLVRVGLGGSKSAWARIRP